MSELLDGCKCVSANKPSSNLICAVRVLYNRVERAVLEGLYSVHVQLNGLEGLEY